MTSLQFRCFRNSDAPALAGLWSATSTPGREPAVTAAMWELFVFSKPYFDPEGLILAIGDGQPAGFAHAGFAPREDRSGLDHSQGVLSLLAAPPGRDPSLAEGLAEQAEAYLRSRGAKRMHAGAVAGQAPFYGGLISAIGNGLLDSDQLQRGVLEARGCLARSTGQLWRCDLRRFRPPMSREMLAFRRGFELAWDDDGAPGDWWEACQAAAHTILRCRLLEKRTRQPAAEAVFWDLAPLATSWHARTMALAAVRAVEDPPQAATFLVGEALRRAAGSGFSAVLAASATDPLVDEIARQLKFQAVGSCSSLAKELD